MRLIRSESRQPVAVGDTVTLSDGEPARLVGWQEPHKPEASGRVTVQFVNGQEATYYAGVAGLEFYPRPDRA